MRLFFIIITFALVVGIASCTHSHNLRHRIARESPHREQLRRDRTAITTSKVLEGYASYYGKEFHGKKTASGEVFDMYRLTAAHRTLPLGTICRVTNLDNHKSVIVKINDRGPFVEDRILDLSYGAARALDAISKGVIPVRIEVLQYPEEKK